MSICFSGNIKNWRPLRALNNLQEASNYDSALQEHIFKKVQREVVTGAYALNEPGPRTITRGDVERFDAADYHATMTKTFPLLTTVITAAAARPDASKTFRDFVEVSVS